MDDRALRILEFTKIREMLSTYALTALGARKCSELRPVNDFTQILHSQEETEEAHVILTYLGSSPLSSFDDVSQYLRLAELGSTLTPKALLQIALLLRSSRVAKEALSKREGQPILSGLANELITSRSIEEEIERAILGEDEISDHASPELYSIRRRIRQCHAKIQEKLNSMIRNPTFQKYLQDSLITMRNDRFVIPVKQEHRGSVPGLIHDQSGSGATLFIEPMAIVEINNDLKQLIANEKEEIERILAELTAEIAPEAGMLQHNQDVLSQLDFAFAKARLSRSMRGTAPKINDQGFIKIIRGRHPLIDPEKVVPIDLWLGETFTTLVITGPNTGGKTVTLKTIGLFTIMAQAGLHVPADLGTTLTVFDAVFADIGDEQSIEQSLSTFSSHMTNIVSILRDVTPRSLALFDELGAGTDPTEGAALAISILDCLLKKRVYTLATTHYSELKAYALTHKGVENAAVEFNVETLRPTYRLSIGIPGKSNAFEISRRLGLSGDIIDSAKEHLSQEQVRFEDVIANAEYHRQIAEKERVLAEEAHKETAKLRDETDKVRAGLEEQRQNLLKKAKDDARRILIGAREEADGIIRDLKKMKDTGGVKMHEVGERRRQLDEAIGTTAPQSVMNKASSNIPKGLMPGEAVRLVHLNTEAVVLKKPDEAGNVFVQAGIMKMTVNLSQLERINMPKKDGGGAKAKFDAARTVSMELDLRGLTVEEALQDIDRYLDEAVLASRHEVQLIHGKGTGALRTGVQSYLRRHPHVEAFRIGTFGEGESGVTVVTLK